MGFAPVVNDQAYLKMGLMGLQGSGKTWTASEIAIGLHKILAEKKIPGGEQPVFMLDTETGANWLRSKFSAAGIEFQDDKTRAFVRLVPAIEEVAAVKGILLIDSITHFWNELKQSYTEQKKRKYGLQFQDWDGLKSLWREFTDALVNSTCHIIMCGRLGYDYDYFEEEGGKKQLEKTGIKMKAESETGYEPNLLVVMERHQELGQRGTVEKVWRTAYVLKDRANLIDGKVFENPTFEDFRPHIECLNLGGEHVGVNTQTSSVAKIPGDDHSWKYEQQQREILLEEIQELMKKHHPSQSADDKQTRIELMEEFFQTRSWKKVETFDLNGLKHGLNRLHDKLEGRPLYPELPLSDGLLATSLTAGAPF